MLKTPQVTIPKLHNSFRANIYAQAIAFILNIGLYAINNNPIFIWVELACLSFIGTYNAKSPRFFDRNILNHFISVMFYYLLSLLIGNNNELYLVLIFVFTYSFFILRNNGYHKSLNLWMYIQALLIGATFTSYPFHYKIIATIIAYLEAQIILNIAFHFISNSEVHDAELRYHEVASIPLINWLDTKRPEVKLALRGAFTAGILYAICSSFHDMKPNWAVVTAVSCLLRDDFVASFRAMKGISIGTLIGFPISMLIIHLVGKHIDISTIMLWIFMLSGLISSFNLAMQPRLFFQIASSLFFMLAATCVALSLQVDAYLYLFLKTTNSLIGVVVALISLLIWKKIHKLFAEVKIN